MNKRRNTETADFLNNENNKSFYRFLKEIFEVNSSLYGGVFENPNSYHEKLLIIYANIRV